MLCSLCHLPTPKPVCPKCARVVLCDACQAANPSYMEWHSAHECPRWCKLPLSVRAQPRLDVLWMLVRYATALEEDMSGQGGVVKERVDRLLEFLQGHPAEIPRRQLETFAKLSQLPVESVKGLIQKVMCRLPWLCQRSLRICQNTKDGGFLT